MHALTNGQQQLTLKYLVPLAAIGGAYLRAEGGGMRDEEGRWSGLNASLFLDSWFPN